MEFDMKRLQQWMIEQTYYDFENLIYDVCHKFQRRYGGNFDDLHSECNDLFLSILKSFDPHKAKLSTWLRKKLWFGLLDLHKKGKRRKNYQPDISLNSISEDSETDLRDSPIKNISYEDNFNLFWVELLDVVDEDAKAILDCITSPDANMMALFQKVTGARSEKRAIKKYFVEHHSWSEEKVYGAFNSIFNGLNILRG
jgi:DNA-directed RNA polymerase specialized sigma24 family protein